MSNRPLVSIIIPVYNVEKYIDKCIGSVLEQTYADIEVILVDDGSPDNCPSICDRYSISDSRVFSFHKENGGLSDARNYGILKAKGEYVFFLDSDDWIEKDAIEKLVCVTQRVEADVVIGKMIHVSDAQESSKNGKKLDGSISVMTNDIAMKEMLYQKKYDTSACGSIIRRELCVSNMFPKGRHYEDLFTFYRILWNSKTVVYLNEYIYLYRDNSSGIMSQSFSVSTLDELEAIHELEKFVDENCIELKSAVLSKKFSCYIQVYRKIYSIDTVECDELRKMIWGFLASYRKSMMLDRNARAKNRVAAMLSYGGKRLFGRII